MSVKDIAKGYDYKIAVRRVCAYWIDLILSFLLLVCMAFIFSAIIAGILVLATEYKQRIARYGN